MKRRELMGVCGVTFMLGASGCGTASLATVPSAQAVPAQSNYRVQVDMPAAAPSAPRQRFRPRGATIYLRGVPIIPETYPIPDPRRGNVMLRGVRIIPRTFDAPYPRPEAEVRRQRQWATTRVQLTAVENRIRQLEDMWSYTTVPSLRYRIWAELQQQRSYATTLRAMLSQY